MPQQQIYWFEDLKCRDMIIKEDSRIYSSINKLKIILAIGDIG
jgi:hypothetical protein